MSDPIRYTPDTIYTYVRNAVKAVYSSAYTTSKYEPTPSSFPCVMVRTIGQIRPTSGIQLDFADKQIRYTVEIQVFSNKKGSSQSQANAVMDVVSTAMNDLYFIQDMREPVDNADATISRVIARFHRIVGGGDAIEERS